MGVTPQRMLILEAIHGNYDFESTGAHLDLLGYCAECRQQVLLRVPLSKSDSGQKSPTLVGWE